MRASTTFLLVALGGALVLAALTRSKQGGVTLDSLISGLSIAGSRVKGLLLSRGYRNNNPGNIEWIDDPARRWRGMVGRDGRYGVFDTPENGTRALGGELRASVRKGQRSIRAVIAEWAPPPENDTAAYVADVLEEIGLRQDQADDAIDILARAADIARAIAKHENGYVDAAYNWQWVYLT